MKRRLCTICARGGSKGVKNKNLRMLAGRPLLVHTLEHARAAGIFDAICVSSDSEAILRTATAWGVDHAVERPADLASDTAAKIPAIRHAVRTVEERVGYSFDIICDLDATAPLRTAEDVRGALTLLETSGCSNVITAVPSRRSPYFNMVEEDVTSGVARLVKPLPAGVFRRQDAPPCFDMNASIYVWHRDALNEGDIVFKPDTLVFKMPDDSVFDIDHELDFEIVELLLARREREGVGQ